ncbi:MAG: NUDIX hydrolase [Oscillospiraceae bacterium]
MAEHYETKLSSEDIFKGRIISLSRDTVRLENGETSTREVVRHNGGAGVIAIDDKDNITLVRQYRYPNNSELIEIPAGKLEKGENPFEAAKRELGEEAALIAGEYKSLGYIIPTCGYCDEKIYIYAAKSLTATEQNLDDDEFVTVFTLPLKNAVAMVMDGEITDSKTVAAILKLKLLRDSGEF